MGKLSSRFLCALSFGIPSFLPHQHQIDLAQSDGIHSAWREGDLRTLLIRVPPWPLYEEAHHDGVL